MKDLKFHARRKELVNVIRSKGITDERVLKVMGELERHLFIPDSALHSHAYEDKAFPIGSGQTISQPYTVAFQSQLLNVAPGDKVLEIGTGSGYQAAVLSLLGADVYTIERHKSLYDRTLPRMQAMGFSDIKFYYGDGFKGKRVYAPFDKIIVTAAAPKIPDTLLNQLKIGGVFVLPLNNNLGNQDMIRITKIGEKEFEKEVLDSFSFVPMLKGTE